MAPQGLSALFLMGYLKIQPWKRSYSPIVSSSRKNMKAVKITDTTFRDAHQSLMATRMRTDSMLPIAEKMDHVGFHSLEVWGGATFDVCIRFLNEDPWERLRNLRDKIKTHASRCFFEDRTLSVTAITPMMC
jgi:pyruvate carboxylase